MSFQNEKLVIDMCRCKNHIWGVRINHPFEIRPGDEHAAISHSNLKKNKAHGDFYPGSGLPEDNSPMPCLSWYLIVVSQLKNT